MLEKILNIIVGIIVYLFLVVSFTITIIIGSIILIALVPIYAGIELIETFKNLKKEEK